MNHHTHQTKSRIQPQLCRWCARLLQLLCLLPLLWVMQAQAAILDNPDGVTYTDTATGLVWMSYPLNATILSNGSWTSAPGYTFAAANSLTGTVSYAGQSDWRLPTREEFLTLAVYISPSQPSSGSSSQDFWSSSPSTANSSEAFLFSFDYGAVLAASRDTYHWVTMVRGNQYLLPQLTDIYLSTNSLTQGSGGTVSITPAPNNAALGTCTVDRTDLVSISGNAISMVNGATVSAATTVNIRCGYVSRTLTILPLPPAPLSSITLSQSSIVSTDTTTVIAVTPNAGAQLSACRAYDDSTYSNSPLHCLGCFWHIVSIGNRSGKPHKERIRNGSMWYLC